MHWLSARYPRHHVTGEAAQPFSVRLLPAALSTEIGSQVQKPLVVVVVAGMMVAPRRDPDQLPAVIAAMPEGWG